MFITVQLFYIIAWLAIIDWFLSFLKSINPCLRISTNFSPIYNDNFYLHSQKYKATGSKYLCKYNRHSELNLKTVSLINL